MAERHFTQSGANAALPLVRSIVFDLVESGQRLREVRRRYAAVREQAHPSQVELNDLHREALRLEARRDACITEVQELGLRVDDVERGIVDFPSSMDGERILLCWLCGEPRVEWYHGSEDGYADRQPVPVPVSI